MSCESVVLTLELVPGIGATGVCGAATTGTVSVDNLFTHVPCNISTVATSPSAVTGGDISVVIPGPQRVFARVSFEDATAGELQLKVNGTVPVNGTASIANGAGYVLFLLPAAVEGDLISLFARTTLVSTASNAVLVATSMTLLSYGTTPFEAISVPITVPSGGFPLRSDSYALATFTSNAAQSSSNVTTCIPDDNTSDTTIVNAKGFRLLPVDTPNRIVVTTGGTYKISASATTNMAGVFLQIQVITSQTQELLNVLSANAESSGGQDHSNLIVTSYAVLPPNSSICLAMLSPSALSVPPQLTQGSIFIQRVSTPVEAQSGLANFGLRYAAAVNEAETITTYGSQFSSLAGFTTRVIPAGTYRFLWSLDCDVSAPASVFYLQLQIDGVAIDRVLQRPVVSGLYEKIESCSIIKSFPTASTHSVQLTTRVSDSYPLVAVKTRKVRVEMFRVA